MRNVALQWWVFSALMLFVATGCNTTADVHEPEDTVNDTAGADVPDDTGASDAADATDSAEPDTAEPDTTDPVDTADATSDTEPDLTDTDEPDTTAQEWTLHISVTGNGTGFVETDLPGAALCRDECDFTVPVGTAVRLTATPDADSRFGDWTGCVVGLLTECSIAIEGDASVAADFVALGDLVVDIDGAGTGTVASIPAGVNCATVDASCTATFDVDQQVELTATADAGSRFIGWTGSCSGADVACPVAIAAQTSVKATFAVERTLTVTRSGSGAGTVQSADGLIDCGGGQTACAEAYVEGTTVTLSAAPEANARFDAWSVPCDGTTGPCAVTVDSDTTIDAGFIRLEQLALTITGSGAPRVTSNPPGIDCTDSCIGTFDVEANVTLSDTSDPGTALVGWSPACTGSGDCSVTMSGPVDVTADFVGGLTIWGDRLHTPNFDVTIEGVTGGPNGELAVVGYIEEPITLGAGAAQVTVAHSAGRDGFVALFDSSGALLWARAAARGPSLTGDSARSARFAPNGKLVVGGVMNFTAEFDTSTTPLSLTAPSPSTVSWVVSYDAASGDPDWAVMVGAEGSDTLEDLAVDPTNGDVVIAGHTTSDTFPADATGGTHGVTEGVDAFLAKLDAGTGTLVWSRVWGTANTDLALEVEVSALSDIAAAGRHRDATFDIGDGPLAHSGLFSGWVGLFDTDGNIQWSKSLTTGGSASDWVALNMGLGFDAANDVVFGTDYKASIVVDTAVTISATSSVDGAVIRLAQLDGAYMDHIDLTAPGNDELLGAEGTPDGGVLVSGTFNGGELDYGGATTLPHTAGSDGFVVKYDSSWGVEWTRTFATGLDDPEWHAEPWQAGVVVMAQVGCEDLAAGGGVLLTSNAIDCAATPTLLDGVIMAIGP